MQAWEEKLKFKKDGMAEGLQIGREEAREEGINALIITSFELGATNDVVSNKLMELFHLTEDEARERYFNTKTTFQNRTNNHHGDKLLNHTNRTTIDSPVQSFIPPSLHSAHLLP